MTSAPMNESEVMSLFQSRGAWIARPTMIQADRCPITDHDVEHLTLGETAITDAAMPVICGVTQPFASGHLWHSRHRSGRGAPGSIDPASMPWNWWYVDQRRDNNDTPQPHPNRDSDSRQTDSAQIDGEVNRMTISQIAIRRIAEDKAAEDETYRRQLQQNGRPLSCQVREMSDDQLVAKLQTMGLEIDRDTLDRESHKIGPRHAVNGDRPGSRSWTSCRGSASRQ